MTEGFSFRDWVDGGNTATLPAQPRPHVDLPTGLTGGDPYANKALAEECANVAAAPEGRRNHQLNTSTFNLAGIVAAGRIGRDEVVNALTAAARAAGLDDTEITPTIQSGFRGSDTKVGARAIPDRPDQAGDTTFVADLAGSTQTVPAAGTEHVPAAGLRLDVRDLEADFWDRPSLRTIYDAALARMCAPWAVLAHCTARALCLVRPHNTLPAVIGGPGSLNWFAVVAAPSGGGKGAAASVARELIVEHVNTRNLGSGEGIIGAYLRPASDEGEAGGRHESIMFLADEVDTVAALGARTGSTLMGILRSGFSGETLGFSYVSRPNFNLDAHTYRLTMIISVQPARAGALLGDHGGGTPQRFMWMPGTDPRVDADKASEHPIVGLNVPAVTAWQQPRALTIPAEARQLILTERAKAARGEQGALDGHAVFCREKFAYALAVLDGRATMTSEDWRLSGIAAEVSGATRDWVALVAEDAAREEARERGRIMGVTAAASDDEKAHEAADRTRRIGRLVLDKLSAGPMTDGALRRLLPSRDRPWLPGSLQALQMAELIRPDDKKWALV